MRSITLPLVSLLLLGALACDEEERLPPPDQTYTARGRIEKLPTGEKGDLMIHHEAMPAFVDEKGEKVGMKAMVMPFTPADDLSLEGFSADDPVEFTFEVRWGGNPMLRVTDIQKLPPDTPLGL